MRFAKPAGSLIFSVIFSVGIIISQPDFCQVMQQSLFLSESLKSTISRGLYFDLRQAGGKIKQ
jgi:hypothetical protein